MENVRKKRRLKKGPCGPSQALAQAENVSYMQNLPDNVLLHILKYLSFPDLIAMRRVCRRFNGITSDRSLWKDVELAPRIMSVNALHKLLRTCFSKDTRSLKLRGYLQHYSGKPKQLKCILTKQFLALLNAQCPTLEIFSLLESHIPNTFNLSDFPSNLTKLQLRNCHFQSSSSFFSDMAIMKLAATLKELDLSLAKGLSVSTFMQIGQLYHLQVLSLHGSAIVGDREIQLLAGCFPELESLDLGQLTNITDFTLNFIGDHFKNLRYLNIFKCNVTNAGIVKIAKSGLLLQKIITDRKRKYLKKPYLRPCLFQKPNDA